MFFTYNFDNDPWHIGDEEAAEHEQHHLGQLALALFEAPYKSDNNVATHQNSNTGSSTLIALIFPGSC